MAFSEQNRILDHRALGQLFDTLEETTEIIRVQLQSEAPTEVSLRAGQRALMSGRVRGLQVRYLYKDEEWWDTLRTSPLGFGVCRVRHSWS